MLNYIWVSLVILGILVAVVSDARDEYGNTYRNGVPLDATIELHGVSPDPRARLQGDIVISTEHFSGFYGTRGAVAGVREPIEVFTGPSGESMFTLQPGDSSPLIWRTMAQHSSVKGKLSGKVQSLHFGADGRTVNVVLVFEQVHHVRLRAITDAALEYAGVAVNISIGLIGIMALWLGVMKVAEEAGILKLLARVLAPLTSRLFPDVPADHPAMSAIIMNVAANMLGLSNAATPLGLKAMEELNRLNPRLGTATNAMCTFLAINTGGLILIPATAIAVRAAAGSGNPGIIIGTSIFGATCATVAGVAAAKILQRLPHYRITPEADHG